MKPKKIFMKVFDWWFETEEEGVTENVAMYRAKLMNKYGLDPTINTFDNLDKEEQEVWINLYKDEITRTN